MEALLRLVSRAAASGVPVLIVGESGTGKELVARLLHESSARASGPFVAESCAALADTLLEAELFGVVRGAFTGADRDRPGLFRLAHGGTLFLDEVAELSPACQGKLLRALEQREVRPVGGDRPVPVDVRVVTATHADLAELVRAGEFREDLYYRLNVLAVRVPPLRERREDLPLLIDHFLDEVADRKGILPPTIPPAVLARLQAYDWPGNVRELRNVVDRFLALGEAGLADATPRSPDVVDGRTPVRIDLGAWGEAPSLAAARAEFDRRFLEAVLAQHEGNITRAAEALGMRRSNLSRLMHRRDRERP